MTGSTHDMLKAVALSFVVGAVLYANYVLCGDQFSVLLCSFALCEALHEPIKRMSETFKRIAQHFEDHSTKCCDIWGVRDALKAANRQRKKGKLVQSILKRSVIIFLLLSLFRLQPVRTLFICAVLLVIAVGVFSLITTWVCGKKRWRLDVGLFRCFATKNCLAVLTMLTLLFGSVLLGSMLIIPAAVDCYTASSDLIKLSLTSDAAASRWSRALTWGLEQVEAVVDNETRPIYDGVYGLCLGNESGRDAAKNHTAVATYAYLERQYNASEWWPIAQGVRKQLEDDANSTGAGLVKSVRIEVESVYGEEHWWSLAQPFVDALIVPISQSILTDGIGTTDLLGDLSKALSLINIEFVTGSLQKSGALIALLTSSLSSLFSAIVNGALGPLVWLLTLLYYFYTLLVSDTHILERLVRVLHTGSATKQKEFENKVRTLVYNSLYLPFQMSCALASAALVILLLFSIVVPVYYISIAVTLTFFFSFFPLLGALGYVVVVLPWSFAIWISGGNTWDDWFASPLHGVAAILLALAFYCVLTKVQAEFLKNVDLGSGSSAVSIVALVFGWAAFGAAGIFIGPFLAGAFLLVANEIAPPAVKKKENVEGATKESSASKKKD